MLNVTKHQRNANWNHNEIITSHLSVAVLNKSTNKCGPGCREKGILLHCRVVRMPIGAATVKSSMSCLKKLKTELPYDPAIPLLEIYSKKATILIWKNICTPMFVAAFFTMIKVWKQPKCPLVDKWINTVVHLRNQILLGCKKRRNSYPWQQYGWTWRALC